MKIATASNPEPGALKLYHFPASGNCRIVRLVLAEKGLSFERVTVNVGKAENRTPEFLKLNPRGKVPVLVHTVGGRELVLAESTVINEYLEDAFPEPPLMPCGAAERAQVRSFTHSFDTELTPAAGPLIIEKLLRPAAAQRAELVSRHQAMTREILGRIASALAGPYLAGEYSLADASLTPAMTVMLACGIDLAHEFPPLNQWFEAVKRRPSFAASEI